MITPEAQQHEITLLITNALREDVGDGDHSSLACVPETAVGKAQLLVKEAGIIAGVDFAQQVFAHVDAQLDVDVHINDGTVSQAILYLTKVDRLRPYAERLLNAMQRMSAFATKTVIMLLLAVQTPNYWILEKPHQISCT